MSRLDEHARRDQPGPREREGQEALRGDAPFAAPDSRRRLDRWALGFGIAAVLVVLLVVLMLAS